ncbi:AMP-binding protein [Acinetobacter johnsonii]|uniref:acyl-CoA synthetase n=1 Tax=Acinetobacter TaxID=469 RepID=UPI00132AA470|nr:MULTISPECIES: acyl-CoA synthetase [Acinetobacter]MWC18530.1 AMP-binding protein [Acinetobacter johnsonii]NAR64599.1 AMP-binding protein [Acinetobacter haemolyticus]
MHPIIHANTMPDKPACIFANTKQVLNYKQMNDLANQCANLFRKHGLKRGDVVSILLENSIDIFTVAWGAQRSGLYLTAISCKTSAKDLAYILENSETKMVIVSECLVETALEALKVGDLEHVFLYSTGPNTSIASFNQALNQSSTQEIKDTSPGGDMLYSSGSTGRPKGIRPALPVGSLEQPVPIMSMGSGLYHMNQDTVYLSTSPLYHAAPLRWALAVHRFGGTVVIMDKFDAEKTLDLIEDYQVSHATFVPTHFIRLLNLPESRRNKFDKSSLKAVIHAAAPCPVPVKQAMINWWGPIIHEYYSGTEQCGITALDSNEWLKKPGSVGKAVLGTIKVLDENQNELSPGQVGDIYFADGPKFEYYKDPEKTKTAYSKQGWSTLGDIGWVDEEGYLYLTDRKNFMIISGGVNIYPQEIENLLMTHSDINDVAVFGIPDNEMGEKVVAVIQLKDSSLAGAEEAEKLKKFVRHALGGVKCPQIFEFCTNFPREATGKILKRKLIEDYKNSLNGSLHPHLA